MRRLRLFVVVGSLAVVVSACNSTSTVGAPGTDGASSSTETTPATPAAAADKEWTSPNKNPASTRFSSLNEINASNVKSLKVAWTFSTGVLRGHEGGPLVIGSTMFVHTPFPNI